MTPLKQYMKVNWQEEKWILLTWTWHHWHKFAHHNCQTGNRTLNFKATFTFANVEHQHKVQSTTSYLQMWSTNAKFRAWPTRLPRSCQREEIWPKRAALQDKLWGNWYRSQAHHSVCDPWFTTHENRQISNTLVRLLNYKEIYFESIIKLNLEILITYNCAQFTYN